MNRIRIAFVLFCALPLALLAPPAAAQTPLTPEALLEMEDAERSQTLTALLQPDRVPEFIALCNATRASRTKKAGGEWLLDDLYSAFRNYYAGIDLAGRAPVKEFVQARMREFPEDRTWPVLHITCLITDAWTHRGNGWSYEVTEEGWKGFNANLNEAYERLTTMLPDYPDDMKPYDQMVTVCMGLGRSDMEIFLHLRKGFRIDPVPLELVRGSAYAFLPRWLGEDDGAALVRLAEWCAKESADTCGDAMYLVVASQAAAWDGADVVMNQYGFNPERIYTANQDYAERIAASAPSLHYGLQLLCAAGEREKAAERFAAVSYDDAAANAWSESSFNAWKQWATAEGPKPGASALHVAAQSGNEKQIEGALTDGADIDGVDESGRSAIQVAANEGHWDAVAYLLDKGADANIASADEAPPLMRAATEGEAEIVEKLLASGADPNVPFGGSSPLMAAAVGNHLDTLRLLIKAEGIDINQTGSGNWSALFHAIQAKNFEAAALLLDADADPNIITSAGWTALAAAIQSADIDFIRALTERGAGPYSGGPSGWTALHMAVFGGYTEIADHLLSLPEATINATMADGWAPIHQASADGKPEMLAYVLAQNGVDVNLATPQGQTGLHLAARDGREKELRMLLEAGADPSLKNSDGKTPADLAAEKGHTKVEAMLSAR